MPLTTMPIEPSPNPKGLIIAAPSTGAGKTLITLGILRALRREGARLAAFKTGPDYIDPAFHGAALDHDAACINLDGWAMDDAALGALLAHHAKTAELVVGEGVMGLFDGARGLSGNGDGSTADLAARLGLPVVLVVDAKGQGASLAALVEGFARHRSDILVAGIILNRVSGDSHAALLRDALARSAVPILGTLPSDANLALPSRHLGLVQAREHGDLTTILDRAADLVAHYVDLAVLTALARPVRTLPQRATPLVPPLGQRVALAHDAAFSFMYPAVAAGWRAAGAEILPFSPLADQTPDANADAVMLPGGYPELHAGPLANNRCFLNGLRDAARRGAVLYGECGGYMVLGETLTDATGATHRMAGLLPLATSFAQRKLHLGYRQATLIGEANPNANPLGAGGTCYRGHEFHYATILSEGDAMPLFETQDAVGHVLGHHGLRRGQVMGSFIHLIAAMEPG